MDDDDDLNPMQAALESVPCAANLIAQELRQMAAGEGRYQEFNSASPWIKNVWHAAADIIEEQERKKLH